MTIMMNVMIIFAFVSIVIGWLPQSEQQELFAIIGEGFRYLNKKIKSIKA